MQQLDRGLAITRPEDAARFTWVRCPGCANGLWRAYADRIEMPLTLRGGQKRIISVPLEYVHAINVTCEKCGTRWQGSSQETLHLEAGE